MILTAEQIATACHEFVEKTFNLKVESVELIGRSRRGVLEIRAEVEVEPIK